uniref:Uncharacterized protein n=1 Tax=Oryzias latipes TaxID=8090 RepID=A0A3P9K8E2_ORYLA
MSFFPPSELESGSKLNGGIAPILLAIFVAPLIECKQRALRNVASRQQSLQLCRNYVLKNYRLSDFGLKMTIKIKRSLGTI